MSRKEQQTIIADTEELQHKWVQGVRAFTQRTKPRINRLSNLDPIAPYRELAFQGFAREEGPGLMLSACYSEHRHSLEGVDRRFLDAQLQIGLKFAQPGSYTFDIKEQLKQFLDTYSQRHYLTAMSGGLFNALQALLPVAKSKSQIQLLSGMEQYTHRVMSAPGYWVKDGDYNILRNNLFEYCCLAGANVVELCVGDGVKAGKIVGAVREWGAPKSIMLADRVSLKYLNDVTVPNLVGKNGSVDNIHLASGDICGNDFWNEQSNYFDHIRNDDAPTVVLLDGATWNNFTFQQQRHLLKKFREYFKPGSIFLISIDGTTHIPTLEGGYHTKPFCQWLMTALYVTHEAFQGDRHDMNIAKFDALVDFSSNDNYVAIKPHVVNHSVTEGFKHGKVILIPPRLDFDAIYKMRPSYTEAALRAEGQTILKVMNYRTKEPHLKNVEHAVWKTQLPIAKVA